MIAIPGSNHHVAIPYRYDIDGLRAISILGVVLFHAFPGLLTGGFIGVDVFFVISGFLITSILFKSLHTNEFSLLHFYQKRILRIFPALLTILVTVYVCGWFLLYAKEFQLIGKHIAAGAGFVQNFVLLGEASNYFDEGAHYKLLMHLWSLAIEEQFYIVYPLLIWLVWKLGGKYTRVIVPLLVASFAYCVYAIHLESDPLHASRAFFHPHARMWELLTGAFLACLLHKPFIFSWRLRQASATIGLLVIVSSFCLITPDTVFPSWSTWGPVGGAALLILSGPHTWVNQHILSNKPMQFVGKISYPLYLWHWPILALAFVVYGEPMGPAVNALLLLLSFGLAWATYAYIERPLRFGKRQGLTSIVLLCVMLLVGFMGYNTFKREGLSFRPIHRLNPIPQTATYRTAQPLTSPECGTRYDEPNYLFHCYQDKTKPIRYAVWGDSKAESLFWGLLMKQNSEFGWRLMSSGSCPPLSGAVRTSPAGISTPEFCAKGNQVALRTLVQDDKIQAVILGSAVRVVMGHTYADDSGQLRSTEAMWHGVSGAITALEKAGKKVIFLIDNPTLPDPWKCMPPRNTQSTYLNQLLERPIDSKCTITYQTHLNRLQAYLSGVAALQAKHPQLIVYKPDHLLCELDKGICSVLKNEHFLYSYTDHLSDYGAGLLADEIVKLVEPTGPASGSP
jgi:peptidoglycan/LPS O-acetylase OafA/YrhL